MSSRFEDCFGPKVFRQKGIFAQFQSGPKVKFNHMVIYFIDGHVITSCKCFNGPSNFHALCTISQKRNSYKNYYEPSTLHFYEDWFPIWFIQAMSTSSPPYLKIIFSFIEWCSGFSNTNSVFILNNIFQSPSKISKTNADIV